MHHGRALEVSLRLSLTTGLLKNPRQPCAVLSFPTVSWNHLGSQGRSWFLEETEHRTWITMGSFSSACAS